MKDNINTIQQPIVNVAVNTFANEDENIHLADIARSHVESGPFNESDFSEVGNLTRLCDLFFKLGRCLQDGWTLPVEASEFLDFGAYVHCPAGTGRILVGVPADDFGQSSIDTVVEVFRLLGLTEAEQGGKTTTFCIPLDEQSVTLSAEIGDAIYLRAQDLFEDATAAEKR